MLSSQEVIDLKSSKIVVVVSVDWEGRSLLPENLELIGRFRRQHPDVPMQHFLNAAYYTRRGINAVETTELIRQALVPEDQHDIHIHAWHSLLAAASVKVREEPRGIPEGSSVPRAPDDWGFYPAESGYDVPLESFELAEIERLICTSREILVAQGFGQALGFRAGLWMAGSRVHAALAKTGFTVDCSAVDATLCIRRFGDIPVCRWLSEMWPEIDVTSQPNRVSTPFGALWEVPNNGGLVDYTSSDDLVRIFRLNVNQWQKEPKRSHIISTGFHQETARKFLGRLDSAIEIIKRVADEEHLPVVFSATPQDYLNWTS